MPRGLGGDPHRLQPERASPFAWCSGLSALDIAWQAATRLSFLGMALSLFNSFSFLPTRKNEVTAMPVRRLISTARRRGLAEPTRVVGVSIEWGALVMLSSWIDGMSSLATRGVNAMAVDAQHLRG